MLELEHAMGFRDDNSTTSLYPMANGDLCYYSAAVGIIYDLKEDKQRFFTEHDDDISILTVHPNGRYVATGQVGKKPWIYVWDSVSMQMLAKVGTAPPDPAEVAKLLPGQKPPINYFHERLIVAMCFSDCGKYLVTIGADDYHMLVSSTTWLEN